MLLLGYRFTWLAFKHIWQVTKDVSISYYCKIIVEISFVSNFEMLFVVPQQFYAVAGRPADGVVILPAWRSSTSGSSHQFTPVLRVFSINCGCMLHAEVLGYMYAVFPCSDLWDVWTYVQSSTSHECTVRCQRSNLSRIKVKVIQHGA